MERPERYDPEDIEFLLHERGFDELLPEERAYVLRHLSGRSEYEAMRSLLLNVRQGQATGPAPRPEPGVRDAVMRAYRERNRPAWRIWLNSIGAIPMPGVGRSIWRPAYAMAAAALIIAAGIAVVLQLGTTAENGLAEVREVPAARSDHATKVEPRHSSPASTVQPPVGITKGPEPDVAVKELNDPVIGTGSPDPLDEGTAVITAETVEQELDMASTTHATEDVRMAPTMDRDDMQPKAATTTEPRIVTFHELARNQTVSNATGQVRSGSAKEYATSTVSRDGAFSRTMEQDAELFDLVTTGW